MSRRLLLASLVPGSAVAAQVAAAHEHARQSRASGGGFESLDPESVAELSAMAERIIPSDGEPGAREAGVIYFVDRALATYDRDKRTLYKTGLAALADERRKSHPASASFRELSPADQDTLLRAIEKTEFFAKFREHVVLGFFGDPSQGGNRDLVGWTLIGFGGAHSYDPPFGHYDQDPGREPR